MADSSSFQEKLIKKHEERLAKIENRRKERLKVKEATNETVDVFLLSFNKGKREVILLLRSVNKTMTRLEISTIYDAISQKMSTLQKFVSDSSCFLPSYDIRRAHEILAILRKEVNEDRESALPKKKFAFKARQKLKSPNHDSDTVLEDSGTKKESIYSIESMPGFMGKSDETLTLNLDECQAKDINLSNLENCIVYLYGAPSAVRIKNVINSRIYCGPVSRSIFIYDCFDCSFQLACQQLRIHSTFNSKFYIHVTSKAIVEDCEDIGFGCFKWAYDKIDEDYKSSGLNRNVNNWRDIDDFNWLKLDEQSPNWHLMQE